MSALQTITSQIRSAVGIDAGLGKSLKLNLKGDGVVFINGGTVTNEDKAADLTITLSIDNLRALAAGRLQPAFAIMVGKMQCSDLSLLMAMEDPLTALLSKIA